MAAKPLELSNGHTWPTQAAAIDHFRRMLARYDDEQIISMADDRSDLLALLTYYDTVAMTDGPSKVGAGVDVFFRRRNDFDGGFSTPGFWVRRVDGTETDFSYIQAVRGKPRERNQEFYEACRVAIAADILAAKQNFFDIYADSSGRVTCEVSGRLLGFEEAHIDHVDPTFRQLVATFRAARGWHDAIPSGVLTAPADGQTQTRFADPDIASAFRDFHKVALLRVVAAEVNSAMAARQQRPRVSRPVVLP